MTFKEDAIAHRGALLRCALLILCGFAALLTACGGDDDDSKKPVPILDSISPATVIAGAPDLRLAVTGSRFVKGSVVQWNGSARATTFDSASGLTATIPASDLASGGVSKVTVANPPPGGGVSADRTFTVENPLPVIASLSPARVLAGSAATTIAVSGSGFVPTALVQWNGANRSTTFVSATRLDATLLATDLATAGSYAVKVVSPTPGGGSSAALTFTVDPTNPPVMSPVIASLVPSSVVAGSPAFALTVKGQGYVPLSVVTWNGSPRETSYLSSIELRASILATDVASAGIRSVEVANPASSGGRSNAVGFTVTTAPDVVQVPERVSMALDGSYPNGPSVNGGVSIEGRYVIFASSASNLVAGDTNDAYDIFLRDTCDGAPAGCLPATTRITMGADGSQANGDSGSTRQSPEGSLAVSSSGRYVAFVSAASNLVAGDDNGVDDVFVYDRCIPSPTACTPKTLLVSKRADGGSANVPSTAPALAFDGRYVVFASTAASLVAGDGNGLADVFLRDTCLNAAAGCVPQTTRISTGAGGADANGGSGSPTFTGRYVAFASTASNLVAGDTNNAADVFISDTCVGADVPCTPTTQLVSVGVAGAAANGVSSDPQVGLGLGDSSGTNWDGRLVAFVSGASNLVAGDTNGVEDVFLRDTCMGVTGCTPSTVRVSVTSEGGQILGHPSAMPDFLSWDGWLVPFVTTANAVVPTDTNNLADVFVRFVCASAPGCTPSTSRVSVGPGGVQGNGASSAPRLDGDLYGASIVTFHSTATNLVAEPAPATNYGAIFKARIASGD